MSTEIINTIQDMQSYSEHHRLQGQKIAFVPTMGYFHEGHMNLMREGRRRADTLVISIFINPTQFGPGEDFERYPRDFDRDRSMAETIPVEAIYYPLKDEMYPAGYQTYVQLEQLPQNLCGISRPGHFRGVATVCAKLFNTVKPHWAIFGKKDYQQYAVIKRMVADLNMDLEVIGIPTTREPDGLAMSSRNVYLSEEERTSSLSLSRSLAMAKDMHAAGERDAGKIIRTLSNHITSQPYTKIDYIKICDANTLQDIPFIEGDSVLAIAVYVGKTRLIDNHIFGEPLNL
jgi:pantoate--beta-alanine ligase